MRRSRGRSSSLPSLATPFPHGTIPPSATRRSGVMSAIRLPAFFWGGGCRPFCLTPTSTGPTPTRGSNGCTEPRERATTPGVSRGVTSSEIWWPFAPTAHGSGRTEGSTGSTISTRRTFTRTTRPRPRATHRSAAARSSPPRGQWTSTFRTTPSFTARTRTMADRSPSALRGGRAEGAESRDFRSRAFEPSYPLPQQRKQPLEDRPIGGRHLQCGHLVAREPSEVAHADLPRLSWRKAGDVGQQEHALLAVIVPVEGERRSGRRLHSQLFPHLPLQRLGRALSRFDLPSGELPVQCEVRPLRALRQQNAAVADDDRRDDDDGGRRGVRHARIIRGAPRLCPRLNRSARSGSLPACRALEQRHAPAARPPGTSRVRHSPSSGR